MKLFAFLFGCRKISVPSDRGADLLNICMKYRYPYYEMGAYEDRTYIVCSPVIARRVCIKCGEMDIEAESGRLCGVPKYIGRFFSRPGLVLGLLIAVIMLVQVQDYVWDIRVSGYEGVDENEVIDGLYACGFYRGCSLDGFCADDVENLFLRRSENIGWISVNMKGTVAYVEVQKKNSPPKKDTLLPANVVAKRDGIILEALTYSGLRMVEKGEIVREGQLLISGAYGEKTPGLHVTRAAGRVSARTFRKISVEIPLEYEEKVESGRVFYEKYMIFFGNTIKVFSNSGNLGSSCDKIVEGKLYGFLGSSLPIGERVEKYVEYETVKRTRSREAAEALAKEELERQLSELCVEEIVSRSDAVDFRDGKCVVECDLTCIEDIAMTLEFTVNYEK